MCRDQWNWARKNPYGYQGQDPNAPMQKPTKVGSFRNGQIDNLIYKESHDLLHGRCLKI